MSLEIKPNQEAKIAALAAKTGRDKSEILEEVIDSYFDELAHVRQMLDQRYDQFKTGRVKELTPEELREDIERRKREFLHQRHEP
jgi:predicted DNA-binding protein